MELFILVFYVIPVSEVHFEIIHTHFGKISGPLYSDPFFETSRVKKLLKMGIYLLYIIYMHSMFLFQHSSTIRISIYETIRKKCFEICANTVST